VEREGASKGTTKMKSNTSSQIWQRIAKQINKKARALARSGQTHESPEVKEAYRLGQQEMSCSRMASGNNYSHDAERAQQAAQEHAPRLWKQLQSA
jgi:hypothetical protein